LHGAPPPRGAWSSPGSGARPPLPSRILLGGCVGYCAHPRWCSRVSGPRGGSAAAAALHAPPRPARGLRRARGRPSGPLARGRRGRRGQEAHRPRLPPLARMGVRPMKECSS
jgi:hypothetical protein